MGRSNINTRLLYGCSSAFTLCPLSIGFAILWCYIATTIDGEISTHANAAASASLGGEGIDSCAATAAWLSAGALLSPTWFQRSLWSSGFLSVGIWLPSVYLGMPNCYRIAARFPLLLCIVSPKTISRCLVGLGLKVIWAPKAETWIVQGREDEEEDWKQSEISLCRIIPGVKDSLFPRMTTSV